MHTDEAEAAAELFTDFWGSTSSELRCPQDPVAMQNRGRVPASEKAVLRKYRALDAARLRGLRDTRSVTC